MPNELRNFLALSYDELEDLNLEAKEQRKNRVPIGKIQEKRLKYLADEKRIKALTVLFSDLVCRLLLEKKHKKKSKEADVEVALNGTAITLSAAQHLYD